MAMTYHEEYPTDHAFMQSMRADLREHPALAFGPESRPVFDAMMEETPAAENIHYEAAAINGIAGWWCRPIDAPIDAAIVYLHGGAYVLGSAFGHRNFASQIAAKAGVATFIVDYRLAPEHPFPAAVDDAIAVYNGLAASGLSKLGLAGDSAGGGLALALLLAIAASKDDSVPPPLAVAVMSPWIDLALTGDSIESRASADPLLTRAALEQAAKLYLGEHDPRDPLASALYGDLTRLPPLLLHVGEDEILLDDSRRFNEKVDATGGSAELHIWQGMVHVFPSNLALQATREALTNIGVFLSRHL